MRRSLLLIGAMMQVLFIACSGEDVPTPGTDPDDPSQTACELTVATCNLLKAEGRREEMSLENSTVLTALCRSVTDTKADLIAFNELDQDYIPGGKYSLSSRCATAGWSWSVQWPNSINQYNHSQLSYSYANGFAWNPNVLTLEQSDYVWLSKDSENWFPSPETAYGKAGSPSRTIVWALFKHKTTGKKFYFFVTHLPTPSQNGGGSVSAVNMAGGVNKFAQNKAGSLPAILCGDMNHAAGTDTYKKLTSYWKDGNTFSWGTMSGSGSQATGGSSYHYAAELYSANHPERRYDHIMTKGFTAKNYKRIITTYVVGGQTWCPSDHLPVVATVTIE